jgi:type IV pilus assembly protein PilO
MALSDLRDIDINDIPSWPTWVKMSATAILAGAILFAGYYFIVQHQIDDHDRVKKQEMRLRTEFADKKALAINLEAYRAQLEEIKDTFGIMLQQLPDKTQVPELLIDITQAGLGRGLLFEVFKPQNRRVADFYAELPINIQVVGSYHDLGNFISDLAALPRIVTIGDLVIKPAGGGKLRMTAVTKTYHYLDEDTVEERRASKKKKQRKQGS